MILNPVVYQTGGGGDKPVLLVTVTGQTAVSVTASKSGTNVSLAYDSTIGKWWAFLPSTGTWTVTASGSGVAGDEDTVVVSNVGVYEVALNLDALPVGYTQLEYISNGNPAQYSDLDIKMPNGFLVEFDFMFANDSTSFAIGAQASPYESMVGLQPANQALSSGGRAGATLSISKNTRHHVEAANFVPGYYLKFDNNTITLSNTGNLNNNRPDVNIGVFGALKSDGTTTWLGINNTLYGLSMYSDTSKNNKVVQLYPAKRNSDAAVGLYDIVRARLFLSNAGGVYIAGPVVS